jgi:hypothetical protein
MNQCLISHVSTDEVSSWLSTPSQRLVALASERQLQRISRRPHIWVGDGSNGYIACESILHLFMIVWIMIISAAGVYTLLIPVLMRETRAGVILARMARRNRKETGDTRFRARIEEERINMRTLIWISCSRPICKRILDTPLSVADAKSHRSPVHRARRCFVQRKLLGQLSVCMVLILSFSSGLALAGACFSG